MRKANLIQTAIWRDRDFLALSVDAKVVYLMLLTQPTVSSVGHLALTKEWWAKLTSLTLKRLSTAIDDLSAAAFVWVADEEQELIIRSWVKHNIQGPKREAAARDHILGVASHVLRYALESEYPDVFATKNAPKRRADGIPAAKRFSVLERDGYACRYCGARSPDVHLEVDHITPRSAGGTNDPDNLITACEDCNKGKGNTVYQKSEYPILENDAKQKTPAKYGISENVVRTGDVGRGKGQLVSSSSVEDRTRARQEVWVEWHRRHLGCKLDAKRRHAIDKGLALFPVETCLLAIAGNHLDPWCNGENPDGKQYHDLDLIFRDAAHIERYADIATNGPPVPKPTSKAGRTMQLAREAHAQEQQHDAQ